MSSALKRRGRIVSFRVSEEEYLNLCQATDAAGADSISDFARHVTCHHSLVLSRTPFAAVPSPAISTNGTGGELHPAPAVVLEVNRLRERVDLLTHQMQLLSRQVTRHDTNGGLSRSALIQTEPQ